MRRVCGTLVCAALVGMGATVWAEVSREGLGVSPALRTAYVRPDAIPFPDDNPETPAKSDLGRRLFFDPILSGARTMSCASCHNPDLHWGDGRARGIGETGVELKLRTPTLLNVAWSSPLGWDGKFRDLESVAFTPITSAGLMNLPEAELVARLNGDPSYVRAFAAAFPDQAIGRPTIEQALATFERAIVSTEAPFDLWIAGDESAIGARAKAGFQLFNGKAGCAECHSGWALTDGSFHDIGVGRGDDIGRGQAFPTSAKLRYAFKTPTLRNVAQRGPYMHDGSVETLRAVIDLYDRGGIDRPSRSPSIRRLDLSETEKADLLAFLETLSSSDGAATGSLPASR